MCDTGLALVTKTKLFYIYFKRCLPWIFIIKSNIFRKRIYNIIINSYYYLEYYILRAGALHGSPASTKKNKPLWIWASQWQLYTSSADKLFTSFADHKIKVGSVYS